MTWGRSKLNTVFPLCPPEAKEPFCSDSPNKFGNSNDDESLLRLVAILNDLQEQNSLFLDLHFISLENDPRFVPYIRLIEPIVDEVLKLTAACCDVQTKNLIASLHVAKKCDGQMDLVKSYLQYLHLFGNIGNIETLVYCCGLKGTSELRHQIKVLSLEVADNTRCETIALINYIHHE